MNVRKLGAMLAVAFALFAGDASSIDILDAKGGIPPGDGGAGAWCVGGVWWTYVAGVGYVPIGRC